MNEVRRVQVDGEGARFLSMLRDFGHIDEQGLDEVLVAVAEEYGSAAGSRAPLSAVRRAAAAFLFASGASVEDGSTLLAEDWPLLFS